MIDFTVFEKKQTKQKLKLYRRRINIALKKNSPEIEQRLLLQWTRLFDHRSEEQTLFQS